MTETYNKSTAYIGGYYPFSGCKVWAPSSLSHKVRRSLSHKVRRDLFWETSKDPKTGQTIITEKVIGKSLYRPANFSDYGQFLDSLSSGVLILTSPRIKTEFEYNNKNNSKEFVPKFVHADNFSETSSYKSMRLGDNASHKSHLTIWAVENSTSYGHSARNYKLPVMSSMVKILEEIGVYYKLLNRVFIPMLFIPDRNESPNIDMMLVNCYYPTRMCHETSVPRTEAELEEKLQNVCEYSMWKNMTKNDIIDRSFRDISQNFSLEPAYLHNTDPKGKIKTQFIYLGHDIKSKKIWIFTANSMNSRRVKQSIIERADQIKNDFIDFGSVKAMQRLFDFYAEMSFTEDDIHSWNKKGIRFNIASVF